MVGTIRPVVYRDHHMCNWIMAVSLHLLGSTIAALVVGGIFGVVGQWLVLRISWSSLWIPGLVAPIALLYSLGEAELIDLPHPQLDRQVPQSWYRKFHPHLAALLYGLGLGTGLSTRIITKTLYIVILGIIATGNATNATLTFGLFGLGRGLPVGIIGWRLRLVHSGEQLQPVLEQIMARRDLVHLMNAFLLALVGGYWLAGLLAFIR